MTTDQTPLPVRVASYYTQLSAAAKDLNAVSDELGKSIATIDTALKMLNLGVVVWVVIRGGDGEPYDHTYWSEDIGYAKIGSTWGICLRKLSGDHHSPFDDEVESWLFNDAPRKLRLSAIEKIPELLEKLSTEATETTKSIQAKLADAQAVAAAVSEAARIPRPRVPLRPRPATGFDQRPVQEVK